MLTLKKIKKVLTKIVKNVNIILVLATRKKCGYNSREDTPVSIPNTEVKFSSADGTWWETAWESRT